MLSVFAALGPFGSPSCDAELESAGGNGPACTVCRTEQVCSASAIVSVRLSVVIWLGFAYIKGHGSHTQP